MSRKVFVDVLGYEMNSHRRIIEVPQDWTDDDIARLSGIDLDDGWGFWDIDGDGGVIVQEAIRVGPEAPEDSQVDNVLTGNPPRRSPAVRPSIEHDLGLRRRLLSHITANLNEHVIETAVDGLKELLTDVPGIAGELLAPLFERSDFWPTAMAKESLGIPVNDDFEMEELLDRFENPTKSGDSNNSDWKEEGF